MERIARLMIPVSLLGATSQAAEVGDPAKGVAIANDVCSRCHAIRKGQLLSPNLMAPTFVQIAGTRLHPQSKELIATRAASLENRSG